MHLKLILPVPPMPTPRARHTKRGHTYQPSEYRQYQGQIKDTLASKWNSDPVSLWGLILIPIVNNRRGDIDNIVKGIFDSFKDHGVIVNDSLGHVPGGLIDHIYSKEIPPGIYSHLFWGDIDSDLYLTEVSIWASKCLKSRI